MTHHRHAWLLVLAACRPSLPPPATPLVASPADGLVAAPTAPPLDPPTFPRPTVVSLEGGPTLMMVAQPDVTLIRMTAVTRRGEDGAHPRGLVDFAMRQLQRVLASRLHTLRAGGGASIHDAWIEAWTEPDRVADELKVLAQLLREPSVDEARMERDRSDILSVLRDTPESADSGAWLTAIDRLHGGRSRLGHGHELWLERYASFTKDAVLACVRERLAPEDTAIIVVGPIDPLEVESAFRASFVGWTGPVERRAVPVLQTDPPRDAALSRATRSERTHVLYVQPAPSESDPAWYEYLLLVESLGGTFTSRLNGSLREQHAYTYGAFAYVDVGDYENTLVVRSDFEPAQVEAALRELFDQMRRLRAEGMSDEEIVTTRARVWSSVRRSVSGHEVANHIRASWRSGVSLDDIEQRLAALGQLTSARTVEVARAHLSPRRGLLLLSGDFARVHGFVVRRRRDGFHLTEE